MMWYRAWLETRPRMLWCLTMFLPLLVTQMITGPDFVRALAANPAKAANRIYTLAGIAIPPGAPGYADALWTNFYLLMAALICLCFSVMLTGSGVCTQSATGMRQGSHASIYFTLSLPVKRRDWVLVRAIGGMVELAVLVLGTLIVPLASSPITHIASNVALLATVFPFFLAGSIAVYSMSVLLSIFLDELWQGMVSLLLLAVLIGFEFTSKAWINVNLLRIMCGGDYTSTGNLPWGGFAACLAATVIFLAAAVYSAERKEY